MGIFLTAAWVIADAPKADADSSASTAWDKIQAEIGTLKSASDEKAQEKIAPQIEDAAKAFYTKYPDDTHALDATMLWAQLGREMLSGGVKGGPSDAEINKVLDGIAANDKTPEDLRAEIRAMQINSALEKAAESKDDAAAWDETEKSFEVFEKEFGAAYSMEGHGPVEPTLRQEELRVLLADPDQTRFKAVVKKLAASPDPVLQQVAADALVQQKMLAELKSKPVDLNFTAVDGQAVDLAKMRGKVVLVDFWATWCAPCRAALPGVIAAYKKYHDKGFEVVGISLDHDKDSMVRFTKVNDMPWPQYLDSDGFEGAICSKYGITAIPETWLVDKKGIVVSTEVEEGLDAKVAKLLAAP